MCGLSGFLGLPVPRDEAGTLLERMASSLAHRGPDDQGVWINTEGTLGFAHRRLSIQDRSPMGAQPMHSPSGRYVTVYNGEIYNFRELRTDLLGRGYAFNGGSDTEVMLAAMEEWGVQGAVPRFAGMFAFAVWDQREKSLWLCRDRLGIKPLYVGKIGSSLAFSSEIRALQLIPGFDTTLDREAISLFMRHDYVPHPLSIYAAVRKIAPGVLTRYTLNDRQQIRQTDTVYWSVEQAAGKPMEIPADDQEMLEQLSGLLQQSVRGRLIADVPTGVFLSGGLDSSLITAIAQSMTSSRLKTFTIGFEEARFDECKYARQVAEALGTDHQDMIMTQAQALAVIPDLSWIYDEPFGDSSQLPTLLLHRMARESVGVGLCGDGGDELFYGYSRYPVASRL